MGKRNEKEEQKSEASLKFIKNCKADIAKFGFALGCYERFLMSVKAFKETGEVLYYRNKQIEEYRNAYLKKNEADLNDAFILDKFKAMSSRDEGTRIIKYETGWFAPRSFWDFILDYKLES